MKSLMLIGSILVISSGLVGCANPILMKVNEDSKRIGSLAQVAKEHLEDCRFKNDKDACDQVDLNLNGIIIMSNGLPEEIRKRF